MLQDTRLLASTNGLHRASQVRADRGALGRRGVRGYFAFGMHRRT
jgi:hypothetical protein